MSYLREILSPFNARELGANQNLEDFLVLVFVHHSLEGWLSSDPKNLKFLGKVASRVRIR
jgi:hypothetical protein